MKQATMDELLVSVDQTIEIKAPPSAVFDGLCEQLCAIPGEAGKPIKLTLERWPGGRWFRDLGDGKGHLWGFVQSIKAPTLLEFFGPMFMSYPVSGHLMCRLTEISGGTKLVFQNQFFGPIPAEVRAEMGEGWGDMLEELKKRLER